MGSVGDAYGNALCESFFATLECELLDRERFRTQGEAHLGVFGFIEGWYNSRRRHSSLDYLSPIAYEKRELSLVLVKAVNPPPNRGNSSPSSCRSSTTPKRRVGPFAVGGMMRSQFPQNALITMCITSSARVGRMDLPRPAEMLRRTRQDAGWRELPP